MTIEQALAVNTLLEFILGPSPRATADDFYAACKTLSKHASRKLSAGWSPNEVDQARKRLDGDFAVFQKAVRRRMEKT